MFKTFHRRHLTRNSYKFGRFAFECFVRNFSARPLHLFKLNTGLNNCEATDSYNHYFFLEIPYKHFVAVFFRTTSGCNTVSNEVKSEILNLIFYFIWITISQSFCDLKYDGSLSCTLTSVYVVEIISFNHINLQCVEKHINNWDELYINRPIEKCYSFQYWLFFMFSSTHTVPGMEVEDVGVFVVVVEITVRTVHVYIISNFSTLLP